MSDIYLEVADYLWFNEYQQGNVNVAGLVFIDLIEESIDLDHDVYTLWVEQVEDAFGIAEDFKPYHLPFVSESLTFREWYGTPLRVKQTILNVLTTNPLVPAMIAHVHLDVLYGVDIYWEEVSSELQIQSPYVNAIPYFWDWIFEEFWIDMTEPQPLPPIIIALELLVNDLLNMRHEVIQEYLFNSNCFEEFFVWEEIIWGWGESIDSSLVTTDDIQEIIGKLADDYLFLGNYPMQQVKIQPFIDDYFFTWDEGTHEKFYLCQADETIEIADGQVSFVAGSDFDTIDERLGIAETATGQVNFIKLATESLVFADISSFVHDLIVEEGLALGDVELARWVFNVLVASGCDIGDIIG